MDSNIQNIDYDCLIIKYLSGEATENEKIALDEAMSCDDALYQDFMQKKRLYNITSQINVQDFDASSAYTYFLENTTEETKSITLKPKTLRYTLQIAASVALLISSWFLYTHLNSRPDALQVATVNEIIEKVMVDSSTISLNKKSKIVYNKNYGNDNRIVQLEGEAFFDIKHDQQHPFTVKTSDLVITDIGTSFNINSNKDNNKIIVTVESGIVKVENIEGTQSVIINKGERAEYLKKEKILRKTVNKEYNYVAWKTKTLVFKDARLQDVMRDLQEYYNTKIELQNPDLYSCTLNAKYDHYTIDSVFEMLQLTFNISVKKENNKYIISGDGCSF